MDPPGRRAARALDQRRGAAHGAGARQARTGRCARHPAAAHRAGRPLAGGAQPIVAARHDDFTLVSCSVGPGFDFDDFSFMRPDGDEAALLAITGRSWCPI